MESCSLSTQFEEDTLEAFLDRYWDFYGELCEFRIKPDSDVAEQLSIKFDQLFPLSLINCLLP